MPKTNIQITILLIFSFLAGIFPVNLAFASEITPESVSFLINQERIKNNLEVLRRSDLLDKVAQSKAQDMIENDYFAHTSPKGVTPWHWFEKEGYDYEFAGENLAINFTSAEKQNSVLMESTTHRKNILSSNFNEIGVAVVVRDVDGKRSIITVQEFGYSVAIPIVAGESSQKVPAVTPVEVTENVKVAEAQGQLNENSFVSSIYSTISSVDYLRAMKASVIISIILITFLIFASFAHRLSEIGSIISKIEKRFFSHKVLIGSINDSGHKIVLKVFPMDMKRIEITHLDHMKQRE